MQKRTIVPEIKKPRRVIFIGDSYGAGYGLSDTSHNWIDYCAMKMGASTGEYSFGYQKSAISGAGFIGQSTQTTFLKQLQSLTTEGAENNLDVTDIVVCGGWNDGQQDISSAARAFKDYVMDQYPFATIHLGYISWEYANKTNGSKYARAIGLQNYCRAAQEFGYAYIANIQYVMHDYSLFQSDGIHPNEIGQYRIGTAVANHLRGGVNNIIDGWTSFTPEWATNVTPDNQSGGYYTYRHDNMSGFRIFNATAWTISSTNFSGHPADDTHGVGWKTLFYIPDGQGFVEGTSFQGTLNNMPMTYYDGTNYVERPTYFRLEKEDGKTAFRISPYSIKSTGYDYEPLQGITRVICNVNVIDIDVPCLYT